MNTNEPTTGEIVRALRYCADATAKKKPCTPECYYFNRTECCAGSLYDNAADRLESQDRTIAEAAKLNEKQARTIAELTARAEQIADVPTAEILDQFKPEITRAREKYGRIKNATTQELASELRDLMQVFDEVYSRMGLERFNDKSALFKVAADLLETQDAEIKTHNETIDRLVHHMVNLRKAGERAIARAESAERERDAAIADMNHAARNDDVLCYVCKNQSCNVGDDPCKSCADYELGHTNFEWRGLPQDGEGK